MGWWLGLAGWAWARLGRRYDLSLLWERLLWWLRRRLQLRRLVKAEKIPGSRFLAAGDHIQFTGLTRKSAVSQLFARLPKTVLLRSIGCRNEVRDLIRDVRCQGNQLGIGRCIGSLIRGFHRLEEMIGIRQQHELCFRRRLF